MTGLPRPWSAASLFPTAPRQTPRIGAEVELFVWHTSARHIALLEGALGRWLRDIVTQNDWQTIDSGKTAPKYALRGGGSITLEPGGQLEYSTPPFESVRALIADVNETVASLRESAARHDLVLAAFGIDPLHTLDETPLQLTGERYRAMDEYFRAIGSPGRRMMRQTAAIQVSIDAAHDTHLTWDVLNRAAPVLTALFANSRMYAGADTKHASYRAATWLALDPTRTGVFATAEFDEYTTFALNARSIADAPLYRPFHLVPNATSADWQKHLTTLFPEVRPKTYFEVRCIDAIPVEHIAAPVMMVAALAWDETVLREAARVLPRADATALTRAARGGMNDDALREQARILAQLAIDASERSYAGRQKNPADDRASAGAYDVTADDAGVLRSWMSRVEAGLLAAGSAPL